MALLRSWSSQRFTLGLSFFLAVAGCDEAGSSGGAASASATASAATIEDVLDGVTGAPITIESIYGGKVEPLAVIKSKRQESDGKWLEVAPKYTRAGWTQVQAAGLLNADYEKAYVAAWQALLADVQVAKPTEPDAQVELLDGLTQTPVPYSNFLSTLAKHTVQLPEVADDSPIKTTFAPLVDLTKKGDDPAVMTIWVEIADEAEAHIRKGKADQLRIDLAPFEKRAQDLIDKRVPAEVRGTVAPWFLRPFGASAG